MTCSCKSSTSSFAITRKSIKPNEHKIDLWLSSISSFVSAVVVYAGLPSELSIHNSFIKQSK
jgi:hypothetical protein